MRLFILLLIGCATALIGFIKTSSLLSSQKQTKSVAEFIAGVKESIAYQSLSPGEIIEKFRKNAFFSFILQEGEAARPSEYYQKICFSNPDLNLRVEDKNRLHDFFCALGTTDTKGTLNHCDMYIKIFEDSYKSQKEHNASKIKLYPSLSVLCGLMIIVVLI